MRNAIKCLQTCWQDIESSQKGIKKSAGPKLVHSEADMAIRVVRDIFNEDFEKLVVSGDEAWGQISNYVEQVAPDLSNKLSQWASNRSEEHTSELQSRGHLVCRLLLEKNKYQVYC